VAQVGVDLIADAKDVSREINKTIREVSLLGQAIDTSNDIAVRTWKNAAESAKEYLNVSGATTEQQLKLEVAMRRTEERMGRMGGETASSTRNMGFFSALVAEASGHLGEHSLSIGRAEMALARFGERSLGVNSVVGTLVASLGKFAIGSVEITAVLVGIDAVVAIYDHFTSATRDATKAQDELIKKLEETERVKLGGGVEGLTVTAANDKIKQLVKDRDALEKAVAAGSAPASGMASGAVNPFGSGGAGTEIVSALAKHNLAANKLALDKKNDDLNIAIAERDEIIDKANQSQVSAFTSDLANLVAHNHATAAERRDALLLLKADQEALGKLASSDVAGRAGLAGEIDKLSSALFPKEKSEKGLQGAELAQLHEANRLGSAAIANLDKRMKDDEKARHDLEALNVHTSEVKASAMDVASPAGALSQLQVIEDKHNLRLKEIESMNIDNDLKLALQKEADAEELAEVQALNRKIAAENARHDDAGVKRVEADSKKHEQVVKTRAAIIESAENGAAQAIIQGRKDIGRALLKAALEPEVKLLEGLSAKQFALAAGDFADGNLAGGAHHLEAGAVFLTEAALVASLAGGGGPSGGGGGGGGGGSNSVHGAQFGASGGASSQLIQIEIVNVTRDQNGRETARTSQGIQRLTDLNYPIRVGALG
jgi:hypothetical protein